MFVSKVTEITCSGRGKYVNTDLCVIIAANIVCRAGSIGRVQCPSVSLYVSLSVPFAHCSRFAAVGPARLLHVTVLQHDAQQWMRAVPRFQHT